MFPNATMLVLVSFQENFDVDVDLFHWNGVACGRQPSVDLHTPRSSRYFYIPPNGAKNNDNV